jgi:CcmD family protein
MKKYLSTLLLSLLYSLAQAQEVEMADEFRSSGKIYVVIAVATTILLGIVVYLFRLDRKVSSLEEKLKSK